MYITERESLATWPVWQHTFTDSDTEIERQERTFTKREVFLHGLSGITQSLQVSKVPQLFDQLQVTIVQVWVFRNLKTSTAWLRS